MTSSDICDLNLASALASSAAPAASLISGELILVTFATLAIDTFVDTLAEIPYALVNTTLPLAASFVLLANTSPAWFTAFILAAAVIFASNVDVAEIVAAAATFSITDVLNTTCDDDTALAVAAAFTVLPNTTALATVAEALPDCVTVTWNTAALDTTAFVVAAAFTTVFALTPALTTTVAVTASAMFAAMGAVAATLVLSAAMTNDEFPYPQPLLPHGPLPQPPLEISG